MDSVSLVAYGDIGSQPGQDITELAVGLRNRELLSTVYCRGIERNAIPPEAVSTPIPLGRTIPRMMSGINRFVHSDFSSRHYSEALFDFFAARQISGADVHLHHTPGYIRTLERGRSFGSEVMIRARTEHTESFHDRIRSEFERLGIESDIPRKEIERARNREKTLEMSDGILAFSHFVKQSLIRNGISAEKIRVTHPGIDADDYPISPWKPSNPYTVIYVGSITVNKGIPYLLEAWKQNGWETDTDARLVLCGRISPTMQNVIDRYNIYNLETPGFVDPRDYHQNASVFAFPSLSEGFAKAPIEAMAAGLPTIVTDHSGVHEIMTDKKDGYIVPAGRADVLADGLQRLRTRPAVRQQMGKEALKTAEEQTWDRYVNRVVDYLP